MFGLKFGYRYSAFVQKRKFLEVQPYCAMVFILITIENGKVSQKYPFHRYPLLAMLLETRPVVIQGNRKHVPLQSTSIIFKREELKFRCVGAPRATCNHLDNATRVALKVIFGHKSATDRVRESVQTSLDASFYIFLFKKRVIKIKYTKISVLSLH